jgi:hypothetical protein
MPGGDELYTVKEGRAPAIYKRSGHVAQPRATTDFPAIIYFKKLLNK